MKMLRGVILICCAALMGAAPRPADRYAEGQVWEYRNRPQDVGSLLKIQRIEDGENLGRIYHISVIGIVLRSVRGHELQHSPVSRATLDASVTRLSSAKRDWPDAGPGITQWREAKGGVFTITVAAIIDLIDQAVPSDAPVSDNDRT